MSDSRYGQSFKVVDRDIRDRVSGTAQAADDLNQQISAAAAEAGAALRDAARRVSAAAGDLGQRAVDRGNRYGQEVIDRVEKQPVTSLLIAATAGFFVGLLMARR